MAITEEEIIRLFAAGNPAAFRTLYDRYAGKMMAVCVRYMGNTDAARDVLQDGFIKIHQHIKEFRSEGSLEGWVRKIIVNTAIRALRKNSSMMIVPNDVEEFELHTSFDDAIDRISMKELLELIGKLPAGYRTVFNLFVLEDYSHKDISTELGITESTSRSQLTKARNMLQEMILRQRNPVSKPLSTL